MITPAILTEHDTEQRRSLSPREIMRACENDGGSVDHGNSISSHDTSTARTPTRTTTDDENGSGGRAGPLPEPERQLDSEDVELTYSPESDHRPSNPTQRLGSRSVGGAGSNFHNAEASSSSSPKSSLPETTSGAKRTRAKASRDEAFLEAPDKPLTRRPRRRPDEIFEEWERSSGNYSVALPHPQESGANQSEGFDIRVLAVSNLNVGESAQSMYPGGPRVFTFRRTPPAECLMGVLFIPPGRGLTHERTSNSFVMFYVVSGKVNVQMSFDHRGGGVAARFGVNKGGAFEVPCETTYTMANGLSMVAHLVFWRWRRGSLNGGVANMQPDYDENGPRQHMPAYGTT